MFDKLTVKVGMRQMRKVIEDLETSGIAVLTEGTTEIQLELGTIPQSRRGFPKKADVDAIYDAYPRMRAPVAAKKAIVSALKRVVDRFDTNDACVQWMINRVRLFSTSCVGKDSAMTPYPATWFNAGEYDSDTSDWFPSGEQKSPAVSATEKEAEKSAKSEDQAIADRETEAEKWAATQTDAMLTQAYDAMIEAFPGSVGICARPRTESLKEKAAHIRSTLAVEVFEFAVRRGPGRSNMRTKTAGQGVHGYLGREDELWLKNTTRH